MAAQQSVRSTVSLDTVVWQMAEAGMKRKGFNNNFSAYVADLIRRDDERTAAIRPSTLVPRPPKKRP